MPNHYVCFGHKISYLLLRLVDISDPKAWPVFFQNNTFKLYTVYFSLSGLNKAVEHFRRLDARDRIAGIRVDRPKQLGGEQQYADMWHWFRQFGEENTIRLRRVDLFLSVWDTTHPIHVEPAFALHKMLAPLGNCSGRRTWSVPSLSTLSIKMRDRYVNESTFRSQSFRGKRRDREQQRRSL